MSDSAIISLDDHQLIEAIHSARSRVIFVAPGLSIAVANALCDSWRRLGTGNTQILLDIDPEVCRMGYGSFEAIQLLIAAADALGGSVQTRPGVRVGILISDDTAIVFSPTPLLIENLSAAIPHPNAIRIGTTSKELVSKGDLRTEADDLITGGEPLTQQQLRVAAADLAANPPLKFDLARRVRVFNSQIEFVEFELKGLSLSRKTVPIPADLIGLAGPKTQQLFRSTFKLVGEQSDVSGTRVTKLKEYIVKRFLIVLPGYGTVILRANKPQFEAAVDSLRRFVARFQKRVKSRLQKEMDANRAILLNALTPSVCAKPPDRWKKLLGPDASKENVQRLLNAELEQAFGSADDLFEDMRVKLVFKGVTYESLTDPKFIDTASKAIPSLKVLHEEYETARLSRDQKQIAKVSQ